MKISVITISFNSADTIESTIESVLAQDYDNVEHIIIDGGSNDKTLSIIEKYKDKIDVLVSEPDKGLYDAMNKGIKYATGDVIGMLNSDDLYADSSVLTKVANEIKNADAVYGDINYVDRDDIHKVTRRWISGIYRQNAFKRGWMPPHPTFYVKAEKYHQLGTYDLRFKTSADYELMLRFIHKHKIKLSYIPHVLVLMRVGGQSNSSFKNRLAANKEDRFAWKLNGLRPGILTFILKPLSKIGQFINK